MCLADYSRNTAFDACSSTNPAGDRFSELFVGNVRVFKNYMNGVTLFRVLTMEATALATSTKPPAILPALPEFISARLFSAATKHCLKADQPLFVAGDAG